MTNINTTIDTTSTALQSFGQIATQVKSAAGSGGAIVTGTGQTVGQQTAVLQLRSMLEMLNTQAGDRYLFSGQRHRHAVGRVDGRHPQWQWRPGRIETADRRAQPGRSRRRRPRTARHRLSPTPTSVSVAEDVAGSPFGFKLNAITSSLTGATVTGPTRIAVGGLGRPRSDQSQQRRPGHLHVQPAGRHDGSDTTDRLERDAVAERKLCDRRHVYRNGRQSQGRAQYRDRHARQHLAGRGLGHGGLGQFLQYRRQRRPEASSTTRRRCRRRSPERRCCRAPRARIRSSTNFAAGDTITVNGQSLTFVAAGATGNQLNVTDSVQTLLTKINSITGTSTPSTVSGGVITLHTDNAASLNVTSSNAARVRGARLRRHRDCGPAAAAGRRNAVEHGDDPGQRRGEHRGLVHRRSRQWPGPGIIDRAGRSDRDNSIRRARQRASHPLRAAVRRGLRRRHDVSHEPQCDRAGRPLSPSAWRRT